MKNAMSKVFHLFHFRPKTFHVGNTIFLCMPKGSLLSLTKYLLKIWAFLQIFIIRVETTKVLQYQCKIPNKCWVVFIFCENCQFQIFIKLKLAQFLFYFFKLIGYQDFYFKNFSQLSKFLVFTSVKTIDYFQQFS